MFALELTTTEEPWRVEALCRDGSASLVELFFSEQLDDIARAKAICAKCTVSAQCLEAALEEGEPWGVWGGELLSNGHIVVHKRRRGRPPRHPRPEPLIDELGFVEARTA